MDSNRELKKRTIEAIDRRHPDVFLTLEEGTIIIRKYWEGICADCQDYGENVRLLSIAELMTKMLSIDIYGENGPNIFKEPFEEEMFSVMKGVIEKHHLGEENFYEPR